MDKKGNYKRIMALGDWIGRFLAEPLSPWDIDGLVDDALTLLSIDHVRSAEDPLINFLIFALDDKKTLEKMSDPREAALDAMAVSSTPFGIDIKLYAKAPFYSDRDRAVISSDIRKTIRYPKILKGLLQCLQREKNTPWKYVLSRPLQDAARNELEFNQLRWLLDDYNIVRERLVVKGRTIEIVNEMVFPDTQKEHHWSRMPALVSRIFVTFLQEGGRDYGRLCKNCNQFILAERKGCRLFCGNRCRVAHKRTVENEEGRGGGPSKGNISSVQ